MLKFQEQTVDYTKWRKGKRVTDHTKIDICPVCGRKGEYIPSWTDKYGNRNRGSVNHIGTVDNFVGWLSVHDWCRLKD